MTPDYDALLARVRLLETVAVQAREAHRQLAHAVAYIGQIPDKLRTNDEVECWEVWSEVATDLQSALDAAGAVPVASSLPAENGRNAR